MNFYLDITLLPCEEVNQRFLWEKIYPQVHLALVEQKNEVGAFKVAVAFPHYSQSHKSLGVKLRLLAEAKELLDQLNMGQWLNRLSDYVHVTSIKAVPANITGYVNYFRPKVMTNKEQLIRRRMKRHNETYEQAALHFSGFQPQKSKAPFVYMKSHTRSSRFPLFIEERRASVPAETNPSFDSYGLSAKGGLPCF